MYDYKDFANDLNNNQRELLTRYYEQAVQCAEYTLSIFKDERILDTRVTANRVRYALNQVNFLSKLTGIELERDYTRILHEFKINGGMNYY